MHFRKTMSLTFGFSLALLGLFSTRGTASQTSVASVNATPAPNVAVESQTKSSHTAASKGYQTLLNPVEGSEVRGVAQFEVRNGFLVATVQAIGLTPGASVPQHIHLSRTCGDAGDILINLDANLTVGGEGEPAGPAYPVASPRGVVTYQASRSLVELEEALQEYLGMSLEDLDLSNRVVNLHRPDEGLPVISCGTLRQARAN